jgi:hypothetical protein
MAKKHSEKKQPTAKAGDGIVVELKQAARFGELGGAIGDPLATVLLEPGVSLNYLVDALRTGIATERDDEEDERRAAEHEEDERRQAERKAKLEGRDVDRVEVPPSPSQQPRSARRDP